MRRPAAIVLIWGAGFLLPISVSATTIHVPADQPTIQAGINAAVDGDTVLVAPGTYYEHLDISGKSIIVRGRGGPDSTDIRPLVPGLGLLRAYISPSATVVEGLTFSRVSEAITEYGGVVQFIDVSATLQFNVFKENSGMLYVIALNGGASTVRYNRLYDNRCVNAVIYESGVCQIQNNTITKNTPDQRGVVWMNGSSSVKNNIIAFNSGVGFYRSSGSPQLSYNDLYENSPNYLGVVPGPGSISENPLFCDTSIRDVRLGSNSPCVGSGEAGADMGALGVGCTTPAPEQPEVLGIGIALPGDSLHVTDHIPRLSWQYFDRQSRPHTRSEIEIGWDNDWTVAEMWQPPTIIGPDTSIEYAGLPLVDGATYFVRVRVFNDTLWSNWLTAPFRLNSLPSAPTPLFPNPGSIVLTGRPALVVANAVDAEGDARRYDFEIYRDIGLTQLAAYFAGKVEGSGWTTWTTDSLTAENQAHWWRARANDGYENGAWSDVWSFIVDAYNEPPSAVNLIAPADLEQISDLTPYFAWSVAADPDPNPMFTYTLVIGLNPTFTFKAELTGLTATEADWPDSLELNETYWWKVIADDGRGGTSTPAVRSFTTVPPCLCPCAADPQCDSVTDVLDVVGTVAVAFRGVAAVIDPLCPRERSDVDCSGATDVLDVVAEVDVAFRGGDPATKFCEPCSL